MDNTNEKEELTLQNVPKAVILCNRFFICPRY